MQYINYTIKFYSDWHAGSGLGEGAGQDSTVIRTKDNLPFLPGKTIKGLVKDAGKDLQLDTVNEALFKQLFGEEHRAEEPESGAEKAVDDKKGCCFFQDAELPNQITAGLREEKNPHKIDTSKTRHLYRTLASTKIDETTGTAQDRSLRSMEVAIPMELEGEIHIMGKEDEEAIQMLKNMLKAVKSLGVNRNRGLGRCEFIIH